MDGTLVEKSQAPKGAKSLNLSLGGAMVLGKEAERKILDSIRKAALSIDYGEVVVKIDKTAPKTEIVVQTQEKIRIEKELDTVRK